MNKNLLIALLAILLIAGGLYLWQNQKKQKEEATQPGGTTEQAGQATGQVILPAEVNQAIETNEVSAADVRANLPGSWQSKTDSKYVLTFTSDGKTTDKIDGKVTGTGSWRILTSLEGTGLSAGPELEGGTLVEIKREAPYYYAVFKLDSGDLGMFYLPQGGIASFTRVSR